MHPDERTKRNKLINTLKPYKMKTINNNSSLTNFDFWAGAKQHEFTYSELKEIEYQLEELYPEGMEETQINDLFWFEEEFLCECIGIDYEEDYLNR